MRPVRKIAIVLVATGVVVLAVLGVFTTDEILSETRWVDEKTCPVQSVHVERFKDGSTWSRIIISCKDSGTVRVLGKTENRTPVRFKIGLS